MAVATTPRKETIEPPRRVRALRITRRTAWLLADVAATVACLVAAVQAMT